MGHGGILYEERIHIPLLARFPSPFRFPKLEVRGDFEPLVSQVDLVPTILGFLGAPSGDEALKGRDLTPFIYGKAALPPGDVFLEELIEEHSIRCLRTAEWKLIDVDRKRTGPEDRYHLYRIDEDPEEMKNLAKDGSMAQILETMKRELARRIDAARRFYRTKDQGVEVDEETRDKLDELGY